MEYVVAILIVIEPAYYEPTIVVRQTKAPRRLCAEWSLPDDYDDTGKTSDEEEPKG